jgi:PQQ-like domain
MEGRPILRIRGGVAVVCTLVLLVFAGQAMASGITNSGDDLRTGWYPGETAITPELVKSGTFGQEWSTKVEGQVYAQPLLANGTLFVATERNWIYGLDPATGSAKWGKALEHSTPWNPVDIGCADLTPSIGATATPVIDPATGVAYMTHKSYASGGSGEARWWMDAIDVASGAEKPGFPVELGGEAQNAPGQKFLAANELQRPGLLLMEGVVYAGFGSHCDVDPYQGWVFGVSTGGTVRARWTTEPGTNGGGIWQSGAGLTSDRPGSILLSTGNGYLPEGHILGSKPPENLGQSIVRLQVQSNGSLKATDFFAPYDANALNEWDADFGSGGVTGLPSEYFGTKTTPNLAVAVGKDGYVYVLNRDELGGFGEGTGGEDKVVQRLGPYGGVWSRPGVWPGEGGWVYIPTASSGNTAGGSAGNLRVYRYGLSGKGTPLLSLAGTSSEAFGFSSGAPVITSNGTASGSALVWVIWSPNGSGVGAQLRAYAPVPVKEEPALLWSAPVGTSSKFATPGVGLGRMYVGTRDEHVVGFGSPVTPALSGSPTEFPPTVVGSESAAKTMTLTANEKVTINSTESIKTTSPQFKIGTISASFPLTLTPGQKLTIPITFAPKGTGPQGANLTVTTSTGKTVPFSLFGTGQAAGPKLEASPTVLTLGGTTVGSSLFGTATFKNVGAATLTITNGFVPAPPFYVEEALPPKMEPNQEVAVPMRFTPTANGNFEGTLTVESTGGTATVHLTGTAAPPGFLQVSPPLNFGKVPIGGEAIRSFSITNTGGLPVKINISKPPIASEFRAITALPEGESTIAPAQTVTETVAMRPSVVGAASDVWRIHGEDASGLHEVLFSGEGVPPTPAGLISNLPGQGVLSLQGAGPLATLAGSALTASRSGFVTLRVRCPADETSCIGTVALRVSIATGSPGHIRHVLILLAHGPFKVAGGKLVTVRLQLSARGRALLTRLHRLRVRATIAAHDVAGRHHTSTFTVTIRPVPARSSH